VLLGREAERSRIAELLAGARQRRSAALVITGEAGVGKSALLQDAVEQAAGFTILAARGLESESELAYSGVADLFRPVAARIAALPKPQARALAGALAVGPPQTGDRFTVCAATLSLLAAVAKERPCLALVDDAHWLDAPSAEALRFSARRLGAEGIVCVLGVRDGETAMWDQSGLPEMSLAGLDLAACEELMERQAGRPIASAVKKRLAAATSGNPLALVEIIEQLTPGQLAGTEPLEELLPVGPSLQRALYRRVKAAPAAAQQAMLVAAASDSGEVDATMKAIRALGADPTGLALAEAAGILTIAADRVSFRHPLLRSVVYHSADAPARRAAHSALAEALATKVGAEDARAWHIAASAVEVSEEVAASLEQVAVSARARTGFLPAARALERAARFSPRQEDRARRLLEAGDAAYLGGQPTNGLRLLQEALGVAEDPVLRARIQHLRGRIQTWCGTPQDAHRLLVDEAVRIEAIDPATAAMMLTDATSACFMTGNTRSAWETARRAHQLGVRIGGVVQLATEVTLGGALTLCGEWQAARELLRTSLQRLEELDPLQRDLLMPYVAFSFLPGEEYAEARRRLQQVVATARAASAPAMLPYALACLSEVDFRTGHWMAAYAGASEAIQLASEMGQGSSSVYPLVCLARVEAAKGKEQDCRDHVKWALELTDIYGADSIRSYAAAALGLLELGYGRDQVAIGHLEEVAWRVEEHELGEPGVVQWAPDLIESYIRCGRVDDARRTLTTFEGQAAHTGRIWALATAARCRGLLADEANFEQHFTDALALHATSETPFERARTQLCFGETLRRHRRRIQARAHIQEALETFLHLGAEPWAARADAELAATGLKARKRTLPPTRELTPQELQVCLVVSEGATNQEAAAHLFVSPRTVEAHLTSAYMKLCVRSRSELVRLFATQPPTSTATANRR
jgi:DNA-binding CsgD family transcriptional regulator